MPRLTRGEGKGRGAWEHRVLSYDPTAGDKDSDGVRVLSDRIVRARTAGPCWFCDQAVVVGSKIRRETAIVDGQIKTVRTCHACCDAMALQWGDHGKALDARFALRSDQQ
jgi:hypothetical protein